MTLTALRDFIASVDPDAQHYESTDQDSNYTVWMETRRLPGYANGENQGGWEFILERVTDTEFDTVAAAFEAAFTADLRFTYTYSVAYDLSTHRIHHSFSCKVM